MQNHSIKSSTIIRMKRNIKSTKFHGTKSSIHTKLFNIMRKENITNFIICFSLWRYCNLRNIMVKRIFKSVFYFTLAESLLCWARCERYARCVQVIDEERAQLEAYEPLAKVGLVYQ